MTIYENDKTEFLIFITPALVSFGAALLLGVLQIYISIALVGMLVGLEEFSNPLYEPIWSLILLFSSQIAGSIIILFGIRWLKVKNVEHASVNRYASLSTLFFTTLTWSLIIISAIVITILIEFYQLEAPVTGLSMLIIPEEILSPITILIFFAPLVIGAPIFEELTYRRLLIPLLEERGMTSTGAVMASSIFFIFLHIPADLIYGNITGTVLHISSVAIIGFAVGISYIKTRNVIYPIFVHGVINGISAVPAVLIEGSDLATLYEIFYLLIIVVIGLLYLTYLLLLNLKDLKPINIQGILSFNTQSFYGFLLISLGLFLIHTFLTIFLQEIAAVSAILLLSFLINPLALIILVLIIRHLESQDVSADQINVQKTYQLYESRGEE
ncbi:MAG: lysostaphin resistance A-like protein [Promethearchaeota archaeon]